jgi:hypothetical protein
MANKFYILFFLLLLALPIEVISQDFPDWMDEVEFKRPATDKAFEFSGPSAPLDPETGQSSGFSSTNKTGLFKKPKLPDFTELRKKAIKATLERKASDSLMFEDSIDFTAENRQKLQNSSQDLHALLKTITDPLEKKKLSEEKAAIDQKLSAMEQLLNIIGPGKASLSDNLSRLSEADYRKALELQRMIFGRPADVKQLTPPEPLLKDETPKSERTQNNRAYRPGKIKSIYLENKRKKQLENEENR